MKKYCFLLVITLFLLSFYSTGSAQGLRFGLKAGAGFSNLHFSDPTPDRPDQEYYSGVWYDQASVFHPTFLIGGVMEYDLTKDFLLSTGLHLSPRFARVKSVNSDFIESDYRLSLWYMQVPLNVHYRAGRFFIGAGGYVGFCAVGKWKNTDTNPLDTTSAHIRNSNGTIVFGNEPETSNLKRMDAGVRAEIGYGFKTVRLSISYDHGLANNVSQGTNANGFVYDAKLKHQAIYATVTYYWLAKG